MQPQEKNKFGRSDLEVSAFGFGTAPVGNIFEEIDEKTSDEMFQVAWDSGVRFYDTAPMYGHGLSEYRTGYSLRWKNRSDFVLSSKVGRLLHPARKEDINYAPWTNAGRFEVEFNYSYDATMRSVDDSLQRMGLESIDILYIHDIDKFTRGDEQPEVFETAMNGAWRALSKLRDERVVKAIGVGVNEWEVCQDALEQRDFDCFLLAGRYTLLEQEALDTFLPLCEQRNASVVVGGGDLILVSLQPEPKMGLSTIIHQHLKQSNVGFKQLNPYAKSSKYLYPLPRSNLLWPILQCLPLWRAHER